MEKLQEKKLKDVKIGARTFIVTAKVISKGSIKYTYQDKSFKIEIYDGSLEHSTLVYFNCQDIENYYEQIELGKVYKFSRAIIAKDAQKKEARKCLKYEMFNSQYIQLVEDESINLIYAADFSKYELIKINQISEQHQTDHFDILGVVMEEPSKERVKDSEGRELDTIKFLIGDETRHTLQVSIRNEYGLNLNLKIFDVVLIKSTHVNVYANQKSVDSGSGILVNPDIQQALDLLYSFEKIIQEDEEDIDYKKDNQLDNSFLTDGKEECKSNELNKQRALKSNKNKEFTQIGENKVSLHFYDVKSINYVVQQVEDQLERVIRLSLTHSTQDPAFIKEFTKCIYSEIEGEIYSAGIEKKPFYVACSVCKKKIENYPVIQKCFKKCAGATIIAKMATNLNIADATGALSALAFNEQCEEIFGFDAEFMKILYEYKNSQYYHKKDPTYRDFIRQSFTQKFRFRILSGVQVYEKKYQAKHNIVGCTKISTLQNIQETAQSIELHLQKRIL
ncbi:replication factor-A protein (macronuclear) [Tetrahymena thermophila SB210]|uniref:Replication factor-A protein n=2 Tax=Tetrahymena thermophila TaxID=5911 RepID=Q24GF4_TETTS|nr:replication factor-A protein [Tetrahymena thermophila SB210]ADK55677.1 RPA1-like protein 1 [Tetrahymena thermophila]EAS06917.2 replication factor-A protein [Tetrahymena thermophila SB210]|eukprot:XP_001027159.2 replication factor-A protein [Tetrahymena thermophila SB210]